MANPGRGSIERRLGGMLAVVKRRREFIAFLGVAAAWPLVVRAEQPERVRRIGVLLGLAESDPQYQRYVSAFKLALRDLGWLEGRNVQIDYRAAGGDSIRAQALAKELLGLHPDLIVPHTDMWPARPMPSWCLSEPVQVKRSPAAGEI